MSVRDWINNAVAGETVEALRKNGFDAIHVHDKETAVARALAYVKKGDVVGLGGSMTIEEDLLLPEKLVEMGADLIQWPSYDEPEKLLDAMRRQLTADVFFLSSNAITRSGFLVNVDGAGNRVAALTFGPKKVVVLAGVNKIVADEQAAIKRIHEWAAPMNMKRLNLPNPCTKNGYCVDCKCDTRGCRVYSVLRRMPIFSDISVIIVDQELGY